MIRPNPAVRLLLLLCATGSALYASEPTWVEIGGTVYGARPDERGPIGGGPGYRNIITKGDYTANSLDALLEALSQAKAGQTVFIPGETEIDLTARIYIDQLVLEVPAGVTLAGNRGQDNSLGASLTSDALQTPVMIRAAGPNVRITGLRLRGPNPKRYLDHHRRAFGPGGAGHAYYYKLPTSNGITTRHPRLEVDNCAANSQQLKRLSRSSCGRFVKLFRGSILRQGDSRNDLGSLGSQPIFARVG